MRITTRLNVRPLASNAGQLSRPDNKKNGQSEASEIRLGHK